MRLDELTTDTVIDDASFERLEWIDRKGMPHTVKYPYTQKVIDDLKKEMSQKAPMREVDIDEDGEPDEAYHVLRIVRDHFIPSITLSLALNYFNKTR